MTTYNRVTLSTVANGQNLHLTEFELFDTNGVNVALAGTASQTSDFATAFARIANNGIIDDTVAAGDSFSFAHTAGPGVWTLDLAQSYLQTELSSAVFHNRYTPRQNELERAIGMIFTLHSSDGLTSLQFGVGTADQIQTFVINPPPPSFNRITLSTVTSGQLLNFTELEVFDQNGTNIAPLGTASMSSQFSSAVASTAINGSTDGTVVAGYSFNFAATSGAGTWTLDLAQDYLQSELSTAIFYNRVTISPSEKARAIGMIASLHSVDGSTTVQIGVGTADEVQTFVITPEPEYLLVNPGVATMNVVMLEVDGALSYRVTIDEDTSGRRVYGEIVASIDTEYEKKIRSLTPGTTYTVTMYADYGSGLEQVGQKSIQTLENSPENYDISQFGGDGKYDLSTLDSSEFDQISEILGDLFTTGETLDINISGRSAKVSFVKLGEAVSSGDSVIAPFDSSAGPGQSFTLQLSDSSTTEIDFNEASSSITVNGSEYKEEEGFVLDGKKCYIANV